MKNKFIKVRVTEKDRADYNELASRKGTTLSEIILKHLDAACAKAGVARK